MTDSTLKDKSLRLCAFYLTFFIIAQSPGAGRSTPRLIPIAKGWAKNQINAVIFRRNSIVSYGNTQYVAFYDEVSNVTMAKRRIGSLKWEIRTTRYIGDTRDAHKSISIAVDGAGYLHLVWNQHNSPLQYVRSLKPGSLELSDQMPMVADKEDRVTYPEFYNLRGGNLLFLYRDGGSGKGNLVLNRYEVKRGEWSRVQERLIDGENARSAYWQATVDQKGAIHISWVWRETPDVVTNHDICYAKSVDGGKTWLKSSGEKYQLPITASAAEYVVRIPQHRNLINQTSMAADSDGDVYIAGYWTPEGAQVPQYQLLYNKDGRWKTLEISRRATPFTLGGLGTRRIPISRPQVLVTAIDRKIKVLLIFRDAERGNRISLATTDNLQQNRWVISDLTKTPVGMWEPTFDPVMWIKKRELHLFVQNVDQVDDEGVQNISAQMISVLEWKP